MFEISEKTMKNNKNRAFWSENSVKIPPKYIALYSRTLLRYI